MRRQPVSKPFPLLYYSSRCVLGPKNPKINSYFSIPMKLYKFRLYGYKIFQQKKKKTIDEVQRISPKSRH